MAKAPTGIEPLRVSVPEAARILGVSPKTMWRMIRDGRITPVRDGGRTLLTMRTLRAYVAANDP